MLQGTHIDEKHEATRTHCGPPSDQQGHDATQDSLMASHCGATDGLLLSEVTSSKKIKGNSEKATDECTQIKACLKSVKNRAK